MKHKLLHLQSLVAVALCFIMSMAFISCSDDEDEPEKDSIVGTWLLSQPESDGEYWYCQYNFKSDGTFEVKDWSTPSEEPSSYEASGAWSVSNDYLTLKFIDEDPETYRFSLDGNKLILYDYEEPGANVFVRK